MHGRTSIRSGSHGVRPHHAAAAVAASPARRAHNPSGAIAVSETGRQSLPLYSGTTRVPIRSAAAASTMPAFQPGVRAASATAPVGHSASAASDRFASAGRERSASVTGGLTSSATAVGGRAGVSTPPALSSTGSFVDRPGVRVQRLLPPGGQRPSSSTGGGVSAHGGDGKAVHQSASGRPEKKPGSGSPQRPGGTSTPRKLASSLGRLSDSGGQGTPAFGGAPAEGKDAPADGEGFVLPDFGGQIIRQVEALREPASVPAAELERFSAIDRQPADGFAEPLLAPRGFRRQGDPSSPEQTKATAAAVGGGAAAGSSGQAEGSTTPGLRRLQPGSAAKGVVSPRTRATSADVAGIPSPSRTRAAAPAAAGAARQTSHASAAPAAGAARSRSTTQSVLRPAAATNVTVPPSSMPGSTGPAAGNCLPSSAVGSSAASSSQPAPAASRQAAVAVGQAARQPPAHAAGQAGNAQGDAQGVGYQQAYGSERWPLAAAKTSTAQHGSSGDDGRPMRIASAVSKGRCARMPAAGEPPAVLLDLQEPAPSATSSAATLAPPLQCTSSAEALARQLPDEPAAPDSLPPSKSASAAVPGQHGHAAAAVDVPLSTSSAVAAEGDSSVGPAKSAISPVMPDSNVDEGEQLLMRDDISFVSASVDGGGGQATSLVRSASGHDSLLSQGPLMLELSSTLSASLTLSGTSSPTNPSPGVPRSQQSRGRRSLSSDRGRRSPACGAVLPSPGETLQRSRLLRTDGSGLLADLSMDRGTLSASISPPHGPLGREQLAAGRFLTLTSSASSELRVKPELLPPAAVDVTGDGCVSAAVLVEEMSPSSSSPTSVGATTAVPTSRSGAPSEATVAPQTDPLTARVQGEDTEDQQGTLTSDASVQRVKNMCNLWESRAQEKLMRSNSVEVGSTSPCTSRRNSWVRERRDSGPGMGASGSSARLWRPSTRHDVLRIASIRHMASRLTQQRHKQEQLSSRLAELAKSHGLAPPLLGYCSSDANAAVGEETPTAAADGVSPHGSELVSESRRLGESDTSFEICGMSTYGPTDEVALLASSVEDNLSAMWRSQQELTHWLLQHIEANGRADCPRCSTQPRASTSPR
eukprot:TRINITY_DN67610_c0_g1_i1.p1 TRINITY_DN67610_c0_g1~~TRINITY_DN67610_c0_g1_i1.p1  ORF type:complete len:1098 (-),score=163.17 TRINITY_DN67610_c0_g1_i1:58-3351(-)